MSRSILWSVRLGCLWLLGACAALPDVTPFDTATRDLAAAVKSAGDAAVGEIERMEVVAELEDKKLSGRLRAAWDERDKAMSSFVRYSASLQELAASANDGRKAGAALAEKVAGLATSLGWTDPGGVVDVATSAAAFVWAQIALARSAATMEEAMTTLHPAVERMADALGADFAKALEAAEGAAQFQRGRLVGDKSYRAARDAEKKAQEERTAILTELGKKLDDAEARTARLDVLAGVLAAAEDAAAPYREKLEEIDRRESALRAMIASARSGLGRWSVAHADLTAAIKARRTIDTAALIDAAVELRGLVRKVKEL